MLKRKENVYHAHTDIHNTKGLSIVMVNAG